MRPQDSQCPMCRSARLEPKLVDSNNDAGRYRILECLDCEFAWQWPLIYTASESLTYFEKKYAEATLGSYYDPSHRRAVAELQVGYVESLVPPGSVLDIGAGDGMFLSVAKGRGWKVVGVEPSDVLDRPAEVIHGTLADLPRLTFDVVTMLDVIEHLEQPDAMLEQAFEFVKPGGFLIVETGNYQCAARIAGGPKWWAYHFDHRWYFAPPVLRKMLANAGFKPDAKMAERVLQPNWNCERFRAPSMITTVKRLVKTADPSELSRHYQYKHAETAWKDWAHLDIVTLVAQRP